MWAVFISLNLLVLHCAVSSSPPSPTNIVFTSVNLKNVLTWSPGNGTPDDTHFTVQYAIYGDSVESSKGKRVHWREVRQCTKIVRHWCDLSNETWDQEQGYYARVHSVGRRASSKWAVTIRRFDPKSDTSFGPPLVSVDRQDNSAIITLKGPMRYQPNDHMPVVSMATFYPQMTYNLSIHNVRRSQIHHFLVESSPYKFQMMEYDTEYCFSAKTRFLAMPIQCRSSEWLCITTPQDPVIGQLHRVVVSIVVPFLCMCALLVVGYFLCNYLMGKGQKSPYILNPPSFHPPPLTFPNAEKPNIIVITIESPSDTDPAYPPALGPINCPDPPPRYSSQRPETPLEPNDDSSVDYGLVGIAPKTNVMREEKEIEKRNDREGNGNELKGKCGSCGAENSYEKKGWSVEDGRFTGFYAPQAKSCLPLKSTVICKPTHMPIHTQTEMSRLAQLNSGFLTQTQFNREPEDRMCTELFINKNPQTGLFHMPLNLQTNKEVGRGEDMQGKARVTDEKFVGDADGGSKSEKVPLLSAYASQNMTGVPPFLTERSDFLPDDYGVLRLATAHSVEGGDEKEEEEEEEGSICINWNHETRKLVLPGLDMKFNKQRGMDGLMQGKKGSKERMGGEHEEVKATQCVLKLENVFVRQPSEEEEEAAALREVGRGGATGCEVDDFVTKWNLVIPEDQ